MNIGYRHNAERIPPRNGFPFLSFRDIVKASLYVTDKHFEDSPSTHVGSTDRIWPTQKFWKDPYSYKNNDLYVQIIVLSFEYNV